MVSSKNVADEQIIKMMAQEDVDLIAAMRNDIAQTRSISEDDRKHCEVICEKATHEYHRSKKEFLQGTLMLIDDALVALNANKLQQVHRAWSLQLQRTKQQCERISIPVVDMLEILSRNEKTIRKKYKNYLAGGVLSTTLTGRAIGFLIAQWHPGCSIHSVTEAADCVALTALVGIVLLVKCIVSDAHLNSIRNVNQQYSNGTQILISKSIGELANRPNAVQLSVAIEKKMNTLMIIEDMWREPSVLQLCKRSVERELAYLH